MSFIDIRNLSKVYSRRSEDVVALEDITLKAEPGEFICILGVSGCGKSTLLKIMAGLEKHSRGTVLVDGNHLVGPHEQAAVVFQEHGLFPWMTVRRNVEFNLKARGVARKERRDIGERVLSTVELSAFSEKYPHELSGGMRQRVGIARALTTSPRLLLMDEPFGALDAQTRGAMQLELLRIWEQHKATIFFVTHSVSESVLLADRVIVMTPRPGRIKSVIPIDLPRPRDTTTPEFNAYVRQALMDLHDDVVPVAG